MPENKVTKRHKKISDEEIIEAIRNNNGFIAAAARQLGCTSRMIQYRRDRNPAISEAVKEIENVVLDTVEARLYAAAANGEAWAIQYILGTKGRSRGYGNPNRMDSGNDSEAVSVRKLTDEQLEEHLREKRKQILSFEEKTKDITAEVKVEEKK